MIELDYLEADLVSHCNLRCAECTTASPLLSPKTYDLGRFAEDVRALSKVLRVRKLRLLGGEPLLVRDLAAYVRAARQSGLAAFVGVVTNGILLDQAGEDLLSALDFVDVSVYSSLMPDIAARVEKGVARARTLTKRVRVERIDEFLLSDYDGPRHDEPTVRRIWEECWQKTKCTSLFEGHLSRCTQGPRRGAYLRAVGHPDATRLADPGADACALHAPDLEARLDAYLRRDEPLGYCHYCLGCSSKCVPHRQLAAGKVQGDRRMKTELSERLSTPTVVRWRALRRALARGPRGLLFAALDRLRGASRP